MLEYATGGTLDQLLDTQGPLENSDHEEFWKKMFNLTSALNCIHQNQMWGPYLYYLMCYTRC